MEISNSPGTQVTPILANIEAISKVGRVVRLRRNQRPALRGAIVLGIDRSGLSSSRLSSSRGRAMEANNVLARKLLAVDTCCELSA